MLLILFYKCTYRLVCNTCYIATAERPALQYENKLDLRIRHRVVMYLTAV